MFNEMLAESVAKATFWVLIIFAVGITARFLIRDIIDFLTSDVVEERGKTKQDEE